VIRSGDDNVLGINDQDCTQQSTHVADVFGGGFFGD